MIEYSSYVGKIAVGRLSAGTIRTGQQIAHITAAGELSLAKVVQVYSFRNLQRHEEDELHAGTIVAVAGIPDVGIGDTLTAPDDPRPLPPITVEEPTVRMTFAVNDSPFSGREGKFLTSRQLRARLQNELERNVALRMEETDVASQFVVSGRGELHLAILIETMRREGYELSVSRPEVIFKEGIDGKQEPVERVYLEALEEYLGIVSEMMGSRRGQLQDIRYGEDGTVYCEYLVPTRGMLGFRQPFMTATRGTGVYHTLLHGYVDYMGDIVSRQTGALIALESGMVSTYALTNLSQRGGFIVQPGDEVYSGQVVGEHIRDDELVVNVCKAKQLTNFRDKPKQDSDGLNSSRNLSLDDAIQFLGDGDLLEVTPKALRIRKKVLRHDVRQRETKRIKQESVPG
jgi:GTP-binding protein